MFSIIIPTLNEALVIENTLKRLRKSRRHQFEVIVSDGGSVDGTLELAERYADKVARAKQGERQTIALGRNIGAREATGKYLIFFDADVFVYDIDDFFTKAVKFLESNPSVVACTGRLKVLPEHETKSDWFFFSLVNLLHFVQNNILGIGAASGEFQLVRREVFERLGGYRIDLAAAEDQEFFRRLARFGRTHFHKDLTVYHTGRRAHKIGWSKLLFLWVVNGLFVPVFDRSFSTKWKEVR